MVQTEINTNATQLMHCLYQQYLDNVNMGIKHIIVYIVISGLDNSVKLVL